jgi:glycosyltransferase involved in cell wall biosynthesis
LEAVGVPKANVVFCDQYHNILGFPSSYMVDVYRAADVLLSPSMGEGFGLPILEAQACGCPVIVGNWTSMPELCFAGWKVSGQRFYTPIGSFQYIPNIRDITWALRDAYAAKGNAELREQARQGALAYDADLVAETYWKPVLTKIEEEIASATGDPVGTVLL